MDELIEGGEESDDIAACAVDEDTMELMKACYANMPDQIICQEIEAPGEPTEDSNGSSAVAADDPSVNNDEGVDTMDELRNATAEQLQQENPTLAQAIANDAVSAERNRIKEINALTRKGAKWEAMAKEAIEEYLEGRRRETGPANEVGGGDSGDNDGKDENEKIDKAAKDIADIAKGMSGNVFDMA